MSFGTRIGLAVALMGVAAACGGGGNNVTGGSGGSGGSTSTGTHTTTTTSSSGTGGMGGGTTTTTTSSSSTGGMGGAGGSTQGAHGPPATDLVNAGNTCTSTSYKMTFTMGQPTQNQTRTTSPSYQMQGGLVGANGTLP
jgi:hypothetical protein